MILFNTYYSIYNIYISYSICICGDVSKPPLLFTSKKLIHVAIAIAVQAMDVPKKVIQVMDDHDLVLRLLLVGG